MTGGKILSKVNIKRGIFQEDSLSPLLFVMTLIPLTPVLRKVKAGYDLLNSKLSRGNIIKSINVRAVSLVRCGAGKLLIRADFLWDFKILTDKQIEANKPDVVLLDKEERKYFLVDIVCLFDYRIG